MSISISGINWKKPEHTPFMDADGSTIMIIVDIADTIHTEVMDKCVLGELFHPKNLKVPVMSRYSIAHAKVAVQRATLPHTLLHSSEAYFILQGTGMMHIGDESEVLRPGMLAYIPPGKVQYIENIGVDELLFLAIVDPMWEEGDEILGSPDLVSLDTADPFMLEAIAEAEKGRNEGGIPIGSVLVRDGVIIGRGHNRREQLGDPMSHAEIDCLRNAGRIHSYQNCILYSTLMPCFLCAGAVVQFKIPEVRVGEATTFEGAAEFLKSQGVRVINYDLASCRQLMTEFISAHPDLWNEDIGEE